MANAQDVQGCCVIPIWFGWSLRVPSLHALVFSQETLKKKKTKHMLSYIQIGCVEWLPWLQTIAREMVIVRGS